MSGAPDAIVGGAVVSRPGPSFVSASDETAVDVPAALAAVTRHRTGMTTPLRVPAGVEVMDKVTALSQPPGSQMYDPSPAFTIAGRRVLTGAPAGAVVKNASPVALALSRKR